MENINHTIGLLKSQNKEAIGLLYDEYAGPIYGIISRIIKDSNRAEEILQDTFVKAWEKGHYYDENKGSMFTWLMRIARNLSINAVQSKAFKKKQVTGNLDDSLKLQEREIPIHTLGLRGHVNSLDEKYVEVINLIYFQGFTHKDAAEELNIPLGTLKSRVKAALSTLRKLYNPE